MYNFFVKNENISNKKVYISGSDYNHIRNVLRMQPGDAFLISCDGMSHYCSVETFENEMVVANILKEDYNDTNLPIQLFLFQGLPKSDKMELIIQKTVELGVDGIIPVEMNRCVVKLDEKKKKGKQSRWQSIAESAAKQSKRNIIPEVFEVMSFKNALKKSQELDLLLVPYESKNGMADTVDALKSIKSGMKVGVFIGPEGGFEENEIQSATEIGGKIISLGKRILRTETAAIAATAMCMLYAEMNLSGENNETTSE